MSTETPPPGCPECGMAWTHPDATYRYLSDKPCRCGRPHVDPATWEQTQHAQGRHHYRAWSLTDAARVRA